MRQSKTDLVPQKIWLDQEGRSYRLCVEMPNTKKGWVVVEREGVKAKDAVTKLRVKAEKYASEFNIPFEDKLS